MRMRKKKNLPQRMERCSHIQITQPEKLQGRWLGEHPGHTRLYIELGCGKGRFTAETAKTVPDTLYVAVERVPEAMVVAMERTIADGTENARFIDMDAAKLTDVFAPHEVDRIYINFCDPWPHARHAKRRLTSPLFLALYREVLTQDGEIHFKTDNSPLFEYSVETFEENGWTLSEVTRNLHENGVQGIMTDYEEKFHNQGVPINRLVAKYTQSNTKEV